MKRKYILITLTLMILALLLFPLFPSLMISSNETGRLLWIEYVDVGEKFIIRYTHSVARTDVDEVIRIGKNELIIDSTIYESFGAGLPFDVSGEEIMSTENGKVTISNINRPVPQIDLRIGQVVANHRLIYRGDITPLKQLSPQGTSVRFRAVKQSIVQAVGREIFK